MIIQVRGTSGAGKSTVVQEVMYKFHYFWDGHIPEGKRKPFWYASQKFPQVGVAGRYEAQCGGCDSIGAAPQTYDLVCQMKEAGIRHILLEGIMISLDSKWTIAMMGQPCNDPDIRVIILTTPLDECIRRIHQRREASNRRAGKDLSITRTTARLTSIRTTRVRMLEAGIKVYRLHQRQAAPTIVRWLTEVTNGEAKE